MYNMLRYKILTPYQVDYADLHLVECKIETL